MIASHPFPDGLVTVGQVTAAVVLDQSRGGMGVGRVHLLCAFQQWQQRDVDSWGELAEHLRQTLPSFEYYEFPTIQRMNFIARTFINEGMRAGIPNSATRRRTITLYLDKQPFKKALNISTEDQISVFLFDPQGNVLWRTDGPFTAEKGADLQTAVASQQQIA